ncbi:LPS assembly protein LptD [Puniceicoccaceae bacterium K14]|nr:LPS assembly protein LptD [Puniceicoccaceae bacterium K14]
MITRVSFRLFLASLAIWALKTVYSQDAEESFEVEFNGTVAFDEQTKETVAEDGGTIRYGEYLLKADSIRLSNETGEAKTSGNVVFTRGPIRLVADGVTYNPSKQFARIENFKAGNGQFYVQGALLEGNPDDFSFTDVRFLPGEPGTFLFKAKASEIGLVDQNEVVGRKIAFNLGALPFLLLPSVNQPIDAETNLFSVDVDYSGNIGGSIGGEFRFPWSDNIQLGANILPTTKRGVLFGPIVHYNREDNGYYTEGTLGTGYIDDVASRVGLDYLGQPIDDHRYFAEWDHIQRWEGKASIKAYARYWSDSEITRDFREDSFDQMQDPDSYLQASYNGDNWQATLFTRASPNDFQVYTERLPELTFTLFPDKIAKGIYQQGFVSVAKLKGYNPSSFEFEDESERADAYYGLKFYKNLAKGISITTTTGARSTHYEESITQTPDATFDAVTSDLFTINEGTRSYGELGVDLKMVAYAESDYTNDIWDIDGLRHIIEPVISYRYTPELDGGDATISLLDRPTISNYLTPIELEERRDIDTLSEEHKVRFELRNRLQTKDEDGNARNLARFSFAMDYFIDDQGTNRDYSDLYADFEITPAAWLEIDLFSRYDFSDSTLEEFNTRVSIVDQGYWKLGFGNHFYRDLLEQYSLHGEYVLNENWKVYGIAKYDEASNTFYEQRLGFLQRAVGDYGIKYEIRFYEGDRRETNFGLSLGIDLFED